MSDVPLTIPYAKVTGAPTPVAPTATVGQLAVAGSATSYMRSDAAPALDPATSAGALSYAAHSFGAP